MSESQSGKTPLRKIEDFCQKFGLPNLFVKDESQNPFGTWKDRRSEMIIQKAHEGSVKKLCLITSGNAGFSLAKFAEGSGIGVVSIVDVGLASSITETLEKLCLRVIKTDLSNAILKPEDVIALARESKGEVVWDVTNGFHSAYESIIDELADTPMDVLLCPLGSGEGFVGLFDGLYKRCHKTRLIGVTVESSPSMADKLHTPWTPYAEKMQLIMQAGHEIVRLSEEEVRSAYEYAKDFITCEPSGAVVLSALSRLKLDRDSKVVIINSGKGLYVRG